MVHFQNVPVSLISLIVLNIVPDRDKRISNNFHRIKCCSENMWIFLNKNYKEY